MLSTFVGLVQGGHHLIWKIDQRL